MVSKLNKIVFLCCYCISVNTFANMTSIEFSDGKSYELEYEKKLTDGYGLNVRYQNFEKKFTGRAGTKVCLVFCFTLPVEEKNLQIQSYSIFAKRDFNEVFDQYDIGNLSAGIGISYDHIEAKTAGGSANSGVNTNFAKLLFNAEHKYPFFVFGKKYNIETFFEYGFFNQSGADVKEWTLKTQLVHTIKEDTSISFGCKLRDIDINYDKDNEIIDLNGADSSIFVGVKSIW